MAAVVPVRSKAHCAGVCSAVGAHGWNINESNWFWHGCLVGVLVRVRQSFGVAGKVSGVPGVVVVFGALLGPEATGPATMSCRDPLGFLVFLPSPMCALGVCGVWGFLVFLPSPMCALGVCGVWGLGLLFENYIVDASIL